MLVTEMGMVIVFKPVQRSKELIPMPVTVLGIIVFRHPTTSVLLAVAMMALQLFLLS